MTQGYIWEKFIVSPFDNSGESGIRKCFSLDYTAVYIICMMTYRGWLYSPPKSRISYLLISIVFVVFLAFIYGLKNRYMNCWNQCLTIGNIHEIKK